MKGRILVWPLAVLLARVEALTMAAVRQGSAPRGLLRANLDALKQAAALDPLEVGVPIARGSQYLIFGDPDLAIESYQAAAALEPRPEIYLNLGRAQLSARRVDEARRSFALAVRLDPRLASAVPPEAR